MPEKMYGNSCGFSSTLFNSNFQVKHMDGFSIKEILDLYVESNNRIKNENLF